MPQNRNEDEGEDSEEKHALRNLDMCPHCSKDFRHLTAKSRPANVANHLKWCFNKITRPPAEAPVLLRAAAAAAPAGGTAGNRMSERGNGGAKPSVAAAPADGGGDGGDGGVRRLQVGDRVFARYRRDRQYYPGVRRVCPPAQRGH